MVAGPSGDVRARAPVWDESVLAVSIDLADCTRARADMPLISDLETMVPHLKRSIEDVLAGTPTPLEYDPAPAGADRSGKDSAGEPRSAAGEEIPVIRVAATSHQPPSPLAIDGALTKQ